MKPLFQRQCEALAATLTSAKKKEENTLYMYTWAEQHTCGTAACICGYQALSKDLALFRYASKLYCLDTIDYVNVSENISLDLDTACKDLFGNDYLASSIYLSEDKLRRVFALKSKVSDEETLNTFKHLTSEYPTLDDAIEYIKFVIEKCEESNL
jgi:hypothetical protein